ncbi:MAG: methionyl-tRNA formyltransferase [Lentisphaerae bacterium]|nr:MAG: methionyl-tRNA formyltransferase [Lentisphaerota bacterium]
MKNNLVNGNRQPLRVVFLGSGEIGLPTLKRLEGADEVDLCACVTQPDRRCGRGRRLQPTPVGEYCQNTKCCELLKVDDVNAPEVVGRLSALTIDFLVVFAFGQLLKRLLLKLARIAPINLHASLLPRYRGASPIQAAILNRDRETGISVMKMVRRLDAGPVYTQHKLALDGSEDTPTLTSRLGELAAHHIIDDLTAIADGRLLAKKQCAAEATYAPLIRKEDGLIDFQAPAAEIEAKVRAYKPWPGAYFFVHTGKSGGHFRKCIIREAEVVANDCGAPAGTVIEASKAGLVIACGDQALKINRLVPEGKREMDSHSFLQGYTFIKAGIRIYETDYCQSRETADSGGSSR